MNLIDDAHEGDIILVEQIDRLARLNQTDWDTLKRMLSEKKLAVVSKELPTSYIALQPESSTESMSSVLQAINSMMLDMLAAKLESEYSGRRKDTEKRKIIASLLKPGHSYSEIQATAKCSRKLIAVIAKQILKYSNTQILKYSNTQNYFEDL